MKIELIQSTDLKFLGNLQNKLHEKFNKTNRLDFSITEKNSANRIHSVFDHTDYVLSVSNAFEMHELNYELFYWLGYYVRMCKEF